jgi:hypothetical protein
MFILIILTSFSSETSRTATKNSPQSTCQLKNSVIGSAGVPTTSTNYQANGTLGQWTTIGTSSGANQDLYAGFWYLIWIQTPTGISVPFIYTNKLFQNYPNPFNPTTTIEYEVGKNSNVDITVYNVMGKRVKRLVDENKSPGHYQATWDGITDRGETVASGVYFYRIQIGNFRAVKKMVLLK